MRYILMGIMLCIITPVLSQEYTPMLADVNEWHLTYCFSGDCNEDVYYTDGEMEVQGNNYKVLDGYHYISREFLLREDLTDRHVYLATIIGGFFREYLLYDFSLEIGDEFEMINPNTPFPEEGGLFLLVDIQTLELADGNFYKHFYFSPAPGNTVSTWDAIWVEGVGSLSLPNAPGGNPSTNSSGRVSCAFREGAVFYTDFEIVEECSPTVLNIDENERGNEFTVITANEKITIKSHQEIVAYKLFDTAGKVILSKNVDSLNETSFDISHFNKGVYFLRIDGNSYLTMEKVIIL